MGLRIDPVPACGSKSSERLSCVKVKELPLPLLLQTRRRWGIFFVVADNPLGGADLEYGALDAAHGQRNRAKRHDRSPKKIRGRLARRCESDGTPEQWRTVGDLLNCRSRGAWGGRQVTGQSKKVKGRPEEPMSGAKMARQWHSRPHLEPARIGRRIAINSDDS